jgi:hypothetical protein
VVYAPEGFGAAATAATAFETHNPWLTSGVAVLGGTLKSVDKWWQRYKARRQENVE